ETYPHSYTSQRVLPSLLHITASPSHTPKHSTASPSLSPIHHNVSFPHTTQHSETYPHSYTSQRVLPSLLHITASPSHTPKHSTASPSLSPIHHNVSFPHTTQHCMSFPHSYKALEILLSLLS
ncbi:hypothetical protein Hamer_G030262, partial [Homarus americanus]